MSNAAERVVKGYALLFARGLIHKINAEIFDIAHEDLCPVGQTFGTYWQGLAELFPDSDAVERDQLAIEHGFADGWHAGERVSYGELQTEWLRILSKPPTHNEALSNRLTQTQAFIDQENKEIDIARETIERSQRRIAELNTVKKRLEIALAVWYEMNV